METQTTLQTIFTCLLTKVIYFSSCGIKLQGENMLKKVIKTTFQI